MAQTVLTEGSYVSYILILFPLIFFLLKQLKFLSSKDRKLPPGPNPWPIIGNIFHMGKKPHISLTNFAQTYGPLISLRLGAKTLVIGSSPAAAIEILKTNDRVLSARPYIHALPAEKSELGHVSIGWSPECGDEWKRLRAICKTELFSGKALETQACLRETKVAEMVKFFSARKGKEVKIADVAFATVFNMLSNVLISRDFISLEEEDGQMKRLIREMFQVSSTPNLSDFYPSLGTLDLQGLHKKTKALFARIRATWEPTVEERRKQSGACTAQRDFLDALLNNALTDDQINFLFLELFAAGTDSSASTVQWAMAELIKNPECMKKVREELAREIKQDLISESHLTRLPYLEACFKETLRLHPAGPLLLPHRASDTCKVMSYTIPRNAQVAVNVWAIGRDPIIWEEPLRFKPERFLNSTLDYKGNNFEFLPFGAGRRICPGLPMAEKQVPLVLASLVYFFDWSLPQGANPNELDMNEKFGTVLQKEQALFLIPQIRK